MRMKFFTVALAALLFVGFSLPPSFAQIGISIGIAPPLIPTYQQPYPPAAGYIWTPGYWAYDTDYYWVPGAWVLPPRVGFVDPRILGLQREQLLLQRRLLGPDRRVLRRDELRLRLRGAGLRRRA